MLDKVFLQKTDSNDELEEAIRNYPVLLSIYESVTGLGVVEKTLLVVALALLIEKDMDNLPTQEPISVLKGAMHRDIPSLWKKSYKQIKDIIDAIDELGRSLAVKTTVNDVAKKMSELLLMTTKEATNMFGKILEIAKMMSDTCPHCGHRLYHGENGETYCLFCDYR